MLGMKENGAPSGMQMMVVQLLKNLGVDANVIVPQIQQAVSIAATFDKRLQDLERSQSETVKAIQQLTTELRQWQTTRQL
jgi:hypothetical protein